MSSEGVRLVSICAPAPHTERGTAGKIDVCEDGSQLVACSGKIVFLRDSRQLTKCDVYTEHLKNVNVARFSPSGGYIASGDDNGLVRVWSPAHPEKILKKETPVLGGPIIDLAWDHESKRLIAGGNGGKGFQVKAFAFDTGSALGEMAGHQKPVTCCAVRPTKPSSCATGSQDFKVGFYKGPPYKFVKAVVEHSNFVQCVRYSWDGAWLCSVGSDSAIHLFDGDSGDAKVSLPGEKEHAGSIYGCSFSPDSKQLLTVGGDKTCKLWDVEKGVVITTVTVGNATEDMQLASAWAKSGSLGPVSLSLGGDLNILDLASGKLANVVKAHYGEPSTLACDWTSDKKEIYVGDSSGGVTRYIDNNGDHVMGNGHTDKVTRVVAKKGKVYSSGFDDKVKMIEGAEFKASATIGSQVQFLNAPVSKPDFCAFVTEKKAGIVKDGHILGSIDLSFHGQGCALSPKGDFLVVGEKDAKAPCAHVYAVSADGTKITATDKKCKELIAPPISMAFSHDGKYLAIGDNLKEVSLWNGETFEPLIRQKWVYHASTVNALAWSPDSKFLLSGSNDSHAYIWNPEAPLKKAKINFAHKTGVTGVDWVNATTIVTCGADRCVRTWEVVPPV
jgi:WD40 repeat protein